MEPRQGAPRQPYEGMPRNPEEVRPSFGNQGEHLNERQLETHGERPALQETEGLPPVIPLVPSAVPAIQDDSAQAVSTVATDNNPVAASDDDLIEKEWVDKAKKIIEETKEDPYRRELEIGKLQRDYIFKRYGRQIGEPGEP